MLDPSPNTWVMQQTWSKLLFAHWPVKASALRSLIPAGLEIDTFEGSAWVAVVPFYMSNVRFRYVQPIPSAREFCELNVRTYVVPKTGGKPGVWFFSLDASSRLAVQGARAAFRLPYYNAQMRLNVDAGMVSYTSRRTHRRTRPAAFEARYQPDSAVFQTQPGTLEHWLTERYCLYAADGRGSIYQGDIAHDPWPLQTAQAEIHLNTMAQAAGIPLPETPPLLHYAESLDVHAWYLRRIANF